MCDVQCEEVSSINANISGGDPMAAFPNTALIPYFDANCIQNFANRSSHVSNSFFNQPNIELSGGI